MSWWRCTNINYSAQIISVHYVILSNLHMIRAQKSKKVIIIAGNPPVLHKTAEKTDKKKGFKKKERRRTNCNLLFVVEARRSLCDYTIDWIICEVRPPRLHFLPLLPSLPLPLSSPAARMAAQAPWPPGSRQRLQMLKHMATPANKHT